MLKHRGLHMNLWNERRDASTPPLLPFSPSRASLRADCWEVGYSCWARHNPRRSQVNLCFWVAFSAKCSGAAMVRLLCPTGRYPRGSPRSRLPTRGAALVGPARNIAWRCSGREKLSHKVWGQFLPLPFAELYWKSNAYKVMHFQFPI